MAVSTEDRIRTAVARVGEEIAERAWTVGRDQKAEEWKRRRWQLLQGVTGAVFALAARQLAARAWGILTGEKPPTKR
jgi:hypothetical protein